MDLAYAYNIAWTVSIREQCAAPRARPTSVPNYIIILLLHVIAIKTHSRSILLYTRCVPSRFPRGFGKHVFSRHTR